MSRRIVKKKAYSIPEVLQYIERLHEKANRISYLLGYRSSEISKAFRKLILTCNSVGIVFLQFDLFQAAFEVLHTAVKTDVCMFFEGNSEDRMWYGRVLVYCNLSYLMHRLADYQSSLKFLYDAESLIVEVKEINALDNNTRDLTLGHALITFLTLTKIHRLEQAEKYIEIAIEEFNSISRTDRHTRLNESGRMTMFCLLTLAGEIIRSSKSGNYEEARDNCVDLLEQAETENTLARSLVERFIEQASFETGMDILLSDDFEGLVFITSFFPFIAQSTPVVSMNELTRAQARAHSFTKVDLRQLLNPHSSEDIYSMVMKESLSGLKETTR